MKNSIPHLACQQLWQVKQGGDSFQLRREKPNLLPLGYRVLACALTGYGSNDSRNSRNRPIDLFNAYRSQIGSIWHVFDGLPAALQKFTIMLCVGSYTMSSQFRKLLISFHSQSKRLCVHDATIFIACRSPFGKLCVPDVTISITFQTQFERLCVCNVTISRTFQTQFGRLFVRDVTVSVSPRVVYSQSCLV
jgi:hypothetical protein